MALKDNLLRLEYFRSIYTSGSLMKASTELRVSQPQLSRVLKILEEDIGRELFFRSHQGLRPTVSGKKLYEMSEEIFAILRRADRELRRPTPELKGKVRIGTYDSIAIYFFPKFFEYFQASHPELSFDLVTGRSSEIARRVENFELDFGVIVQRDDNPDLIQHLAYCDAFGFYVKVGGHTSESPSLIYCADTLDTNPTLMRRSKVSFDLINEITGSNLETIRGLTERGVGVGYLPHRVARDSVLSGVLRPAAAKGIGENYAPHNIVICSPRVGREVYIELRNELADYLRMWSSY